MQTDLREISDFEAGAFAREITANGYAVIENYIPPHALKELQSFVEIAVRSTGGEYIVFSGRENLADTILSSLPDDPSFQCLCRSIYRHGTSKCPPEQKFYQILRCLSGRSGQKHSMIWHYDSYILTALLPVIMPREGKAGDLILMPNVRPIRKYYIHNLLDKVLIDNKLSQMMFAALYKRKYCKLVYIRLKPGNLYLFWGYRSIHANESCDPHAIRSTALFHYGNPHAEAFLRKLLRREATQ